jgi:hypothetical protein
MFVAVGVLQDCRDCAGIPPLTASGSGNATGVEVVGDCSQGHATGSGDEDRVRHATGNEPGAAQLVASRSLGRECHAGSFTNQLPLVLRKRRHDVREHLYGGRGGVDAEVERDDLPALPAGDLHEVDEVDEGSAETVQLGHDQDVTGADLLEQLLQRGTPEIFAL